MPSVDAVAGFGGIVTTDNSGALGPTASNTDRTTTEASGFRGQLDDAPADLSDAALVYETGRLSYESDYDEVFQVAIIGAGVSGLQALRAVRRAGLDAVVLESRPDGPWKLCELPELPWPSKLRPMGDTATAQDMLRYIRTYSDVMRLRPYVRCGSTVTSMEQLHDGSWVVQYTENNTSASEGSRAGAQGEAVATAAAAVKGGRAQLIASFVIVATGMYGTPYIPNIPGREAFSGRQLHAGSLRGSALPRRFRSSDCSGTVGNNSTHGGRTNGGGSGAVARFEGLRIAVLGCSREPAELAGLRAVAAVADAVTMVAERVRWPLPPLVTCLGERQLLHSRVTSSSCCIPPFHTASSADRWVHKVFWSCIKAGVSREVDMPLGGPKSLYDDLQCGGQVSDPVTPRLMRDPRVSWVGGRVAALDAEGVVLSDGRHVAADVILYCTGYVQRYRFLPSTILQALTTPPPAAAVVATADTSNVHGGCHFPSAIPQRTPECARPQPQQHINQHQGGLRARGDGGDGDGAPLEVIGSGEVALYRNMVHCGVRNLAFVGCEVITTNRVLTAALQAEWLARLLCGRLLLPSARQMAKVMLCAREWAQREAAAAAARRRRGTGGSAVKAATAVEDREPLQSVGSAAAPGREARTAKEKVKVANNKKTAGLGGHSLINRLRAGKSSLLSATFGLFTSALVTSSAALAASASGRGGVNTVRVGDRDKRNDEKASGVKDRSETADTAAAAAAAAATPPLEAPLRPFAQLGLHTQAYHDCLMHDLGVNPYRKGCFCLAELFYSYTARDYAGVVMEDLMPQIPRPAAADGAQAACRGPGCGAEGGGEREAEGEGGEGRRCALTCLDSGSAGFMVYTIAANPKKLERPLGSPSSNWNDTQLMRATQSAADAAAVVPRPSPAVTPASRSGAADEHPPSPPSSQPLQLSAPALPPPWIRRPMGRGDPGGDGGIRGDGPDLAVAGSGDEGGGLDFGERIWLSSKLGVGLGGPEAADVKMAVRHQNANIASQAVKAGTRTGTEMAAAVPYSVGGPASCGNGVAEAPAAMPLGVTAAAAAPLISSGATRLPYELSPFTAVSLTTLPTITPSHVANIDAAAAATAKSNTDMQPQIQMSGIQTACGVSGSVAYCSSLSPLSPSHSADGDEGGVRTTIAATAELVASGLAHPEPGVSVLDKSAYAVSDGGSSGGAGAATFIEQAAVHRTRQRRRRRRNRTQLRHSGRVITAWRGNHLSSSFVAHPVTWRTHTESPGLKRLCRLTSAASYCRHPLYLRARFYTAGEVAVPEPPRRLQAMVLWVSMSQARRGEQ
ncbi:hypothetical protein VOLCADRAFT_86917 [Volvox carteri f. nagariensis]|uniref:Flavin-containing monooxygenase n=1 Tax=Volvox carteri f. nagariensis TaxID=3068 RepID=D8TKP8_VOLCA|nr:uncharacterized protein VOLCADRAFT_86917 [Volvox carteri f. nagariensis]EFJ52102.1 hypothetical protein VOLCADRAFT_86917 [Volvox carteri f. nagariensis]|eukprot:XP_002946876.1 hypothetical protein VOLCADRAFT_86917 [Volvox carteri f. nagariensis]